VNLLDAASPVSGFPVLDGMLPRRGMHDTLHDIRKLIDNASLGAASLITWLSGLSRGELEVLYTRSVERASHFKWFLGDGADGFKVWLHEYKSARLRDGVGSFAASVHNHRYSFVSQVLTGSLTVSEFSLGPAQQFPELSRRRTIPARTTYFLSSEQVHRIDAAAPSTCTLVVQGPAERPFSRVFDIENRTFQDMYDLQSRFPELVSVLSAEPAL
jgi:hypothetical protein